MEIAVERLLGDRFKESAIEIARGIRRIFGKQPQARSSPFYSLAQALLARWDEIKNVTNFLTFSVATNLAELYRKGRGPKSLAQFLDAYEHYCNWMHMLRPAPMNFGKAERLLQELAEERGSRVVLQPLASGGDVLVVSEPGVQQDLIAELEVILKSKKIPFELDYASWRDGVGKEGLKIEQFLEQGIASPLISQNIKILRSRDKKGHERKTFISAEELARKRGTVEMLIDLKEQRIYIKGRALTSKELHSTKKTIEILRILDEHFDKEVSADTLPKSSYVDCNEMQSKIVSPLVQIVKRRLSKSLPLFISGRSGRNFVMKLGVGDVDIYWLE